MTRFDDFQKFLSVIILIKVAKYLETFWATLKYVTV